MEISLQKRCYKAATSGAALTEFIREKTGFLWNAVPADNIGVDDLDRDSIEIFKREAVCKKRMTKEDPDIQNDELMDHLSFLVNGMMRLPREVFAYEGSYCQGDACKHSDFITRI